MKFQIKETTLTDGSKITDIDLFANGNKLGTNKKMCIFSCTSEKDARAFFAGLDKLVKAHTVEMLEEV